MLEFGSRLHGPIIQVAMDVFTVEEAIAVGERAMRAGVDWLEVGTPLLTFQGMEAIGAVAQAFPGVPIYADFKLMDGTGKYVLAAGKRGAQLATVCGVASDASIRAALKAGKEGNVKVVVDLYAAPDKLKRAIEVEAMGADLIYVHFGGDQMAENPALDDTAAQVRRLKASVHALVGACTWDIEGAVAVAKAGADVVVVGNPFIAGVESEEMLADCVRRVREAYRMREASA